MSDIGGPARRGQNTTAAVAGTAKDKAAQSAELVGDKAKDVAGTAREQVAGVAGEAASQARDLTGELRSQLREQAHSQTRSLASNVRRLADELQEMSEKGASDSTAAGAVRRIADGGHQVASRMEERGPDGLVDDLRNFARRRPGLFLAGAALAGFAVARAGKGAKAAQPEGPDGSAPRRPAPGPVAVPPTGGPPAEPAGYTDPLDTYGQSQPPHVTPGTGQGVAAPPVPPAPPTPPPGPYDPDRPQARGR